MASVFKAYMGKGGGGEVLKAVEFRGNGMRPQCWVTFNLVIPVLRDKR